jgi:tRNA 2-thiouridine synthesizing protein A
MVADAGTERGCEMPAQVLDVKGLNCPLPILRVKKAMKDISVGDTLQVLATDPGAVKDFEVFCRSSGNELVEQKVDGKVFSFLIRKTA